MIAPRLPDPAPLPTPLTAPFWNGLGEGRLRIQQCDACTRYVFYPRPVCPFCASERLTWRDCSGRGSLLSFTVNHRPGPLFSSADPQIIALVTLDEGARVAGRFHGADPSQLRLGMPVVAVLTDEDSTMLRFAPAEAAP